MKSLILLILLLNCNTTEYKCTYEIYQAGKLIDIMTKKRSKCETHKEGTLYLKLKIKEAQDDR